MKLPFLIISVCSLAEGRFWFPRPRFPKPSSIIKPPKLPSIKPPKLPSIKPPKLPSIKPSLDTLNLAATLGMLGMQGFGLYEANRLQDEAIKNQASLQQAQFEHESNMASNVQAAENLGAPKVCLDCMKEFEKIYEVIAEKAKDFCSKFSEVPDWYDAENQTCTEESWSVFFDKKTVEIFQGFGGKNNKCLKAKSEYLIELEINPHCQVADYKTLRCIFDRYHQLEEAKNSCSKLE